MSFRHWCASLAHASPDALVPMTAVLSTSQLEQSEVDSGALEVPKVTGMSCAVPRAESGSMQTHTPAARSVLASCLCAVCQARGGLWAAYVSTSRVPYGVACWIRNRADLRDHDRGTEMAHVPVLHTTATEALVALQDPVRSAIHDVCLVAGLKASSRLVRNKTTHLICGQDGVTSEKYDHALAWGSVHLVSLEWLLQSLRLSQRQPEVAFAVRITHRGAPPSCAPLIASALPVNVSVVGDEAGLAAGGDPGRPPVSANVRVHPRSVVMTAGARRSDDPDDVLDVVARLTSVVRHAGKRCGVDVSCLHQAADEPLCRSPSHNTELDSGVSCGGAHTTQACAGGTVPRCLST